MKFFRIVIFWIENARYNALPQSLFPGIIACCLACNSDDFSLGYGIAAIFGVLFAHLSMNLLDDYFDYRNKGDEIRNNLAAAGFRARIAKCAYLTSGQATEKQLITVSAIFASLALVVGVFIFLKQGIGILIFVLLAALLGVFYSGNPIRLAYRGLGELVVAIIFGPLLMGGVYYAACGHLQPTVWFVSLPVGLLVANVLYTHSIMDALPDEQVGKMTFARLLKTPRRKLIGSFGFIFLPYLILLLGVLLQLVSMSFLLVFLTLPLAMSLFYLLVRFVKEPQRTFVPRWWMQPMEKWEEIKTAGIDWFMIRWFLARNLMMYFCILLLLAIFLQK